MQWRWCSWWSALYREEAARITMKRTLQFIIINIIVEVEEEKQSCDLDSYCLWENM